MTTDITTESQTPVYDKLTSRKKKFVHNYVNGDRVAVRAYLDAYKCESYGGAAVSANKLLKTPKIKAAIAELMQINWVNRDDIINKVFDEYKALAFSDIEKFTDNYGNINPENLKKMDSRSVKSVERHDTKEGERVKVALHDKTKALSDLSNILGITKQPEVKVGVNLVYLDNQDADL